MRHDPKNMLLAQIVSSGFVLPMVLANQVSYIDGQGAPHCWHQQRSLTVLHGHHGLLACTQHRGINRQWSFAELQTPAFGDMANPGI